MYYPYGIGIDWTYILVIIGFIFALIKLPHSCVTSNYLVYTAVPISSKPCQ